MSNIVVITGQTATGKTSYALQLAKEINGELINADSRQLYKYLNIITGKDIPLGSQFEEMKRLSNLNSDHSIGCYTIKNIPLWLYDLVDPKLSFSSFDYKEIAHAVIGDITARGKTPIIVGGSYLYIKHLVYGFDSVHNPPNWTLREKLNNNTVEELQKKLQKLNGTRLEKMNNSDRNNPRRLIRQIEGAMVQPVKTVSLTPEVGEENIAVESFVGLRFANPDTLAKIIKKRVNERIEQGAFEEVENLLKKGYIKNDPGLITIGYKEIIAYLENSMTKQEATDRWILSEIQYAKRQFTFMKKDKSINWKIL